MKEENVANGVESDRFFSSLDWFCVPLKGTIDRNKDGTKTTPIFSSGWKAEYAKNKHAKVCGLSGVLTGKGSGIIAIDCDNEHTWELFSSLDNDYGFKFVSTKPKIGGTLVYEYEDLPGFSIADGFIQLDVFSEGGFIYLPGSMNRSKEPFKPVALKKMPPVILALLTSLGLGGNKAKSSPKVVSNQAHNLAPQVSAMVRVGKFSPELFRFLTPKSFRDSPSYIKEGYMHPNEVQKGSGSTYLVQVSAILGADASVSEELYVSALSLINSFWDEPINVKVLEATILEPMLNFKSCIGGEPIWKFNPEWTKDSLVLTAKTGDNIEIFFDDYSGLYYSYNTSNDEVKTFDKGQTLHNYLSPLVTPVPKLAKLAEDCPVIRAGHIPDKPFGFYDLSEYKKGFNLFKQTKELAVLSGTLEHKADYREPTVTLKFLSSLVPDKKVLEYLLSFLKTKLTKFGYSPVVLHFMGVSGSGKDTFVQLLAGIVGPSLVARPTGKEFISNFNGWLVGAQFVHMDEYGDQLKSYQDKDTALGLLKSYTGKKHVQIRRMRMDGYNYEHSAIFVLTANSSPLPIEANDRRILFIDTPNRLEDQAWAKQIGVNEVVTRVLAEAVDFCHYLATVVKPLSANQFQRPLQTQAKTDAIAEGLMGVAKLVYLMSQGMTEELVEIAEEAFLGSEEINNIQAGSAWLATVVALGVYLEGKDLINGSSILKRRLKKAGVKRIRTTQCKKAAYKYLWGEALLAYE